jgi:hypothetical protein
MSRFYLLGGRQFQSKQAIRQHMRQFIAAQPLDANVTDPVAVDLLKKHPQWAEKSAGMIGLAIGEIDVAIASTKCKTIVIEKADGIVDISWSKLIDRLQLDGSLRQLDQKAENLQMIKVAARAAIQYQIYKVKKIPGDHIDHIYPRTFDRLLFLFLQWWGQPVEAIKINDPSGAKFQPHFECWEIETNWQIFHERVARLRAITAAENMAARKYPVNWSVLP